MDEWTARRADGENGEDKKAFYSPIPRAFVPVRVVLVVVVVVVAVVVVVVVVLVVIGLGNSILRPISRGSNSVVIADRLTSWLTGRLLGGQARNMNQIECEAHVRNSEGNFYQPACLPARPLTCPFARSLARPPGSWAVQQLRYVLD